MKRASRFAGGASRRAGKSFIAEAGNPTVVTIGPDEAFEVEVEAVELVRLELTDGVCT